ncbi:MAG: phytanoyl-CoA dioxygenase family protein [Pseudomonadota bacterium]
MATAPLKTIEADWDAAAHAIKTDGFYVIPGALRQSEVTATIKAMDKVQRAIGRHVGQERLEAAGEVGVLRLMMRFDPFFFRFLANPVIAGAVDAILSPTAVLHLQNGFVLPPAKPEHAALFQRRWHQDYPRLMNGYLASLNALIAVSDFTEESGATLVIPGSQQKPRPSDTELEDNALALTAPAGSLILFDSTLWHCAGVNHSSQNRMGINHQFTCSWFKQQIDYPRALGEPAIEALPERSQQMLGYFTRVPASLDEYYRVGEARLYRSGQG